MAADTLAPGDRPVVCRQDIVAGLRTLGVNLGDAVMFHSSLRSLGIVEGGAETVVDGFVEAVGPRGTVSTITSPFVGTHWSYVSAKPVFDVRHSPSLMGVISETLRRRPEAVRTLDSSHATASIGAAAGYLAEGALDCFTPCGKDSFWGKLVALDARYVFLGTTWATCTLLHGCEEYAYAPYCFMDEPSRLQVIDHDGRTHYHVQKVHCPGAARAFGRVAPEMAARGLLREVTIGAAMVTAMRARDLVSVGTRLVVENPAFLLRDPGFLTRCRDYQRGLVPA